MTAALGYIGSAIYKLSERTENRKAGKTGEEKCEEVRVFGELGPDFWKETREIKENKNDE